MTTYFISRHPGAIEWARRENIDYDEQLNHLDFELIKPGDVVIGSLPVNLAARICRQGGRYIHLSLELPEDLRGQELSAKQLQQLRATLQEYEVKAK
jgi:CRISPR-associated protein Csx16